MATTDRAELVKRIECALAVYADLPRQLIEIEQDLKRSHYTRIPEKLMLIRERHAPALVRLRAACIDLAALCPDPDPPALTDAERAAIGADETDVTDFGRDHAEICHGRR